MLLQKVTARNRPEAVSVPAECLSYQVTQLITYREGKTLERSEVCTRKQVKYMGASSKEFHLHKSPATHITITRRQPDAGTQNIHRRKDNWLLLLPLNTQG